MSVVEVDPGRPARWYDRFARRRSLRVRLLVGLLLVAALGIVVADFVVYNEIDGYLTTQLDQEIAAIQPSTLVPFGGNSVSPVHGQSLPPDTFIGIYNFSSTSPIETLTGVGNASLTLPRPIEEGLAAAVQNPAAASGPEYFTASLSPSGTLPSGGYRVLAEIGSYQGTPLIIAVAISLDSLAGTLHNLLVVDILVTLAILAALGAIGYAVVRAALRPLGAIERTAGAIAGGDLTRRVEREEPSTEIGRLGAALNSMLSQIEFAFAERQASEERLRQFLADASHELRTPVTSIRGYAELFRRGAQDNPEDLALAMRRIEDEAQRMGVLVDDLLLLARLDQGRPLAREPVDLAAVVADAAADAQVRAPDWPIEVELSGPIEVLGDDARLHQLVANLVGNAIQHTPSGTPITIRLEARDHLARLEVQDQGPGVAPEHAARIFERFYRADAARVRDSGGAGLGLSIVASIAAAHGGVAYLAESAAGACFRVELPLAAAGEVADAPLRTAP